MRRDALNLLAATGVGIFPDNVATEQLEEADEIQAHWLGAGMLDRLEDLSRLIDEQFDDLPSSSSSVFYPAGDKQCG